MLAVPAGIQVMETEPEGAYYHGSTFWVAHITSLIMFVVTPIPNHSLSANQAI